MPTNPRPKVFWMNTAYSVIGTDETPGPKNTAAILKWAKVIGQTDYTADSIPWCGLFVAFVMAQNGIVPVSIPTRASAWSKFGNRLDAPAFGCIMTFTRSGGGHVGFGVGQNKLSYYLLGGNQSDSVSITKIAKTRLTSIRWPTGMEKFLIKGLPYL